MYKIVESLIFQIVIFSLNVVRLVYLLSPLLFCSMFRTKNKQTDQQITVIDLYSVRAETIYTVFKTRS